MTLLGQKTLDLNATPNILTVTDSTGFTTSSIVSDAKYFSAASNTLNVTGNVLTLENDISPVDNGDYIVDTNSLQQNANIVSWIGDQLTIDDATGMMIGMLVIDQNQGGAGVITNIIGNVLTIGGFQGSGFVALDAIATYNLFTTSVSYIGIPMQFVQLSGGARYVITDFTFDNASVDLSGTAVDDIEGWSGSNFTGQQILTATSTPLGKMATSDVVVGYQNWTIKGGAGLGLFANGTYVPAALSGIDGIYVGVIIPAGTPATADLKVWGYILS